MESLLWGGILAETRAEFLVVEPQRLVQLDLEASLREVSKGPRIPMIHLHASLGEVPEALNRIDRLTGAVLCVGAETLQDSGIPSDVEARGGWIVCLAGHRPEIAVARGWYTLPSPFSQDSAHALFRMLLQDPSDTAAAG